uniref:Bm14799 n=1 Tax=Brugia malayi TaxID=6279 RepID=A0A0H5BRW8_BRUMA|nr:Bm487 [Brugia malayi]CDQ05837.1 Bm14799 [Brugia malayi]
MVAHKDINIYLAGQLNMLLGRLEVERLDDICLLGQNGMLELPFAASSIGLVDFLTLGF